MISPFLFAPEMELHTVCTNQREGPQSDDPEWTMQALRKLLNTIWHMVPCLRGPSGVFCPYGRIYIDINQHLEIAICECDSPGMMVTIIEQMQTLLRKAVTVLRASEGIDISLGTNNHSGLFVPAIKSIWGTHENYLVGMHPNRFPEDLIMPFLVTRVYQGAGVVAFPSGDFLAGARAHCMNLATGGSTHEYGARAIHSTSRDENHTGIRSGRYRYHGIIPDGLRSHFNTALQFGASALALRAIMHDRKLKRQLPKFEGDWVEILQRLNRLATPGQPPRVDPLVIATQREYLEASRRYVDTQSQVPAWVFRTLGDWSDTLDAMENDDRAWLAARADAFTKYEFFSSVLRGRGKSWTDLPNNRSLATELELMNCSYHEFTDPNSYFTRLEKAGALKHRLTDRLAPGEEPTPYLPETETRAKARARFILDNAREKKYVIDWSQILEPAGNRFKTLYDPFGQSYSEWEDSNSARPDVNRLLYMLHRMGDAMDIG